MTKIIQEDQVRGGLIDLPPLETFNLPQAVLKVAQEIADCDGIGIETSSFDLLVRLIAYWSRMSLPAQEFKLDLYVELARISPQIPGNAAIFNFQRRRSRENE